MKSLMEEVLAADLRRKRIKVEREYRFHPARKWRFDFAIPRLMIGIEVEGGTHSGGRHTRPAGFEKDCEKYNAATLMGWRVLRFTTKMVEDRTAVLTIQAFVQGEEHASKEEYQREWGYLALQDLQEENPNTSPTGSGPQGRRQEVRQRQAETNRRGEGLPEEGESSAP